MFPRDIENKLRTTIQYYTNLKVKRAKKLVNKGQLPLFELTEKEKIKMLKELVQRAVEINDSVFNDFKGYKEHKKGVNKEWCKSVFAVVEKGIEIEKLKELKVKRANEQLAKWNINILDKGKLNKGQLKALKSDVEMYRNNKEVRKIISNLESGKFDRGDIRKLDNFLKNRNELIARNETGNLYAQEVKDLLIGNNKEKYRWRDCGDSRVRPEHAERNGKIFSIHEDIMPGEDFGCRCSAESIE